MRIGMRLLGSAALIALVLFVAGQAQDGFSKKTRPQAPSADGPLTQAELFASTQKVEAALRRVFLSSNPASAARRNGESRPAKRTEVVAELGRLFSLAKPHFKFTPRFVNYDPKVLSIAAEDPARKPLEEMIRYGCIGRISPIAAGSTSTLTLQEFGDALGFFMLRMGDLTHTPSAKWSPYLFGHKDAP